MDGSKPHLRGEQIVFAARLDTQHCASKRAGESQGDLSRWISPATADFRARENLGVGSSSSHKNSDSLHGLADLRIKTVITNFGQPFQP